MDHVIKSESKFHTRYKFIKKSLLCQNQSLSPIIYGDLARSFGSRNQLMIMFVWSALNGNSVK